MYKLIKLLLDYYCRADFRMFLNSISQEIYETLANSYADSDGEVKIVTEMCNKIDGKQFDKLRIYTKKIHGSRSYVEFNNKDRPITRELADMVLISIATIGNEVVYEKTAFIQNKKEKAIDNWKIDQDQLFLLQNFPTFKGNKGIFKNNFKEEVCFLNHSETLGNYGLLQSPGEMIIANAATVYRLQQNGTISLSEIRKYFFNSNIYNYNSPLQTIDPVFISELYFIYHKNVKELLLPFFNLPFLNNKVVSFNIYDIVRNWSFFNIGELVSANGKIFDENLSKLNKLLLKSAGLSKYIKTNDDNDSFETGITICVVHLNLDD